MVTLDNSTMSFKIDHTTETMADPWLSLPDSNDGKAAASDGDHYEIVVSNNVHGDSTRPSSEASNDVGSNHHQFETCALISNAELAALASSNGVDPSNLVKIEGHNDTSRIHYSSGASDAVHYFDPDATLSSVDDSDEQQRLIKVYQTAMESGDNKLITVYEIKPDENESGHHGGGAGGFQALDSGNSSDRDVMVEIVPSPEDEQLLDGTLVLPSSMSSASFVNLPQSFVTASTTVAELRCTLCGFVSFARDEIAEHCQTAHDLFLCQTCNLVFKRKQTLQAHARSKHGQTLSNMQQSNNSSNIMTTSAVNLGSAGIRPGPSNNKSGSRATGRINKRKGSSGGGGGYPMITSLSQLGPTSQPASRRSTMGTLSSSSSPSSSMMNSSIEMMSDIKDILSKNKFTPNAHALASTSNLAGSSTSAKRGGGPGGGGSSSKRGNKRSSAHDWARVGSLTAQQQALMLDTRLNDPQTRHQFNTEFAKKITSHGIGAEVLGLTEERLPSKKGTFRLDIKERVLENGEPVPVGTSKRDSATGALPDNVDVFYSYDIVDTKQMTADGGCLVICGLCNFSNPRIENVLFHCEIDHKQYYCHNKRCQNGFSSWDSLMRHMKTVHKKEK